MLGLVMDILSRYWVWVSFQLFLTFFEDYNESTLTGTAILYQRNSTASLHPGLAENIAPNGGPGSDIIVVQIATKQLMSKVPAIFSRQ